MSKLKKKHEWQQKKILTSNQWYINVIFKPLFINWIYYFINKESQGNTNKTAIKLCSSTCQQIKKNLCKNRDEKRAVWLNNLNAIFVESKTQPLRVV